MKIAISLFSLLILGAAPAGAADKAAVTSSVKAPTLERVRDLLAAKKTAEAVEIINLLD